jgi:hypothetical protein
VSAPGERKAALLLASLRPVDRRWLLARLPHAQRDRMRRLVAQLEATSLPVAALVGSLLADEAPEVAQHAAFEIERLGTLVRTLPPAWASRVLAAWGGFDARYCLSLLDAGESAAVSAETARAGELPKTFADALRAEVRALASSERREAA